MCIFDVTVGPGSEFVRCRHGVNTCLTSQLGSQRKHKKEKNVYEPVTSNNFQLKLSHGVNLSRKCVCS